MTEAKDFLYQQSKDAQTEGISIQSIADFIAGQRGHKKPDSKDYENAEENLLLALLSSSRELSSIWINAGRPPASKVLMAKFLT